VVTEGTDEISSAGATLQGSFSGATGQIYETGFKWGTSSSALNQTATTDGTNESSGSFSVSLTSLDAATTYYYQAYVLEWDESSNRYVEKYGSVKSFTTTITSDYIPTGWLELPSSASYSDFQGTFYGSGGSTEDNRNYTYNYSNTYYASLWVAYPLTSAQCSGSADTDSWSYNPDFSSSYQVNVVSSSYPSMYGESSYSRGHLVPQADRKSDATMNKQTYYVTNQCPQLQNKFNASIWASLETAERTFASSTDVLYCVTGPCYKTVGGNESITYFTGAEGKNANPSSLPVPNYYWKAFLKVTWVGDKVSKASAIGFWFEHKEYASSDSYTNYAVSVDEIERLTGFDLFANLPDAVEVKAEANSSLSAFNSF